MAWPDNPGGGGVEREPPPGLIRFFEDLVHRSFGDLWIWEGEVLKHVANLLARFARTDALFQVRDLQGKRLETVVEMLIEASDIHTAASGLERERDIRQHVGDYALFMSGIFRAHVERHGFLGFYLQEGERAYRETAKLDRKLYRPGAACFEALATEFERISGALDYMRKVYFGRAALQSPYRDLVQRFNRWN